HLEGVLIGTRSATQGACTYQITAILRAGLVTDTLTGTITYTATTNHHADCGTLETCASTQDFNGLRPPP
ncbi:MAG: hypothetical protein NT062_12775, partial [Proteobacteria bacterium]|nr:hypothetical protein [Pseudomonadota bacterium]